MRDFPGRFADDAESNCRLLAGGGNLVCVSVDAKSRRLYEKVEALAACQPHLLLSPKRRHIFWGGYSLLQATLDCAQLLLASLKPWRYFVNLSAQDFPLHSQAAIKRSLESIQPASVVEVLPEPNRSLYEAHFEVVRNKNGQAIANRKSGRRKTPPPLGAEVKKGNLAVLLSRPSLQWLLSANASLAILHWLRDTDVPDEHFFATVLGNQERLGMPAELGGYIQGHR